jgi:hypothetical protein
MPCYMPRTLARRGIDARLALVAWAVVAVVSTPVASRAIDAPGDVTRPGSGPVHLAEPAPPTTLSPQPPAGGEIAALHQSVVALASRLEDVAAGDTPPPWAIALRAEIDARVERVMQMQERLAARIETPLPRLDEPIILLTVAASTLILGFVLGRGLQRRRDRRDGRFRL